MPGIEGVKVDKAEQLFDRVFFEYGDDSVAQLGGVHLACEQASQILAKAIEWGRLAAYLEQSTRYMRYDDKPGGRWRLTVPPEIGAPGRRAYLRSRTPFETSAGCSSRCSTVAERFPKTRAIPTSLSPRHGQTCDILRVRLPGTRSNWACRELAGSEQSCCGARAP